MLFDHIFFRQMNSIDSPWSVDNLLFEEVLTSDSNDDITNLFCGGERDEGFDEDNVSERETSSKHKELSDEEIKNLRVQELNKILRGMPQDEVANIRRKRRNLKNREYALTCRQRRLQLHEDLINENKFLKRQLQDDREKLRKVAVERNAYKRQLLQLQSACKKEFTRECFVPSN